MHETLIHTLYIDAYHIVNEGIGIYIEFMNELISTNLKSMIL